MVRKVTPEMIESFKVDVANKMKECELSEKYGVSHNTIYLWKKRFVKGGERCLSYEELCQQASERHKSTNTQKRKDNHKFVKKEDIKLVRKAPSKGRVDCDAVFTHCIYGSTTPKLNKCDYLSKTHLARKCSCHNCDKYVEGDPLKTPSFGGTI